MKKIFIAFELLPLSLIATSCTVDSNITSSYQESSNQANMKEIDCGLEYVQGIDEANKTNISSFEEIPIVTDEMLSLGYQGGEGAQWPLCLTGDNKKGNLMFYGTDVGGIFKSTDGGNTWKKKNKGLYAQGICDIQIDPNNSKRVISFGTNGPNISYTTGIYLSESEGEAWQFIKHLPINGYRNTKEDLAFDPSSYDINVDGSSIVYLSLIEKADYISTILTDENKGLYKSSDGGYTWSRINKDLGDSIVKVDSRGYLYCGNYNGLFLSKDKGESFTKVLASNVTGLDVIGENAYILSDTDEEDKLYLYHDSLEEITSFTGATETDYTAGNISLYSENWHLYFVKDGNDKYYQYHYDPKIHHLYTIKVSPANPNNMVMILTNPLYYEAASNTVLYSTDGGHIFNISLPNKLKKEENKEYNILPYANRMMNFYWSPVDENLIYDFENDWLSRSQNKGESFKYYSNGINGIMCGGKFNFNVYDSDIMYFGAQDYHGALTTNGGKSFNYVNLGANNALNDNANIYGGYAANKDILYAVFAPRNSKNRYITISYDGGHTASIIMDDNHLISDGYIKPNGVSRLKEQSNYVSIGSKLDKNLLFCANLRSDDLGLNWHPMSGVTGVYSESSTGVLYGINDTLGQIVSSSDKVITWNVIAKSSDLNKWWNNAYLSDLSYDEINNKLYVTAQWNSLFVIDLNNFKITDLTENIRVSFKYDENIANNLGSDTLSVRRLTTVAVDTSHPEIIYVGGANYKYRSDASLYRSCDGGKTFYVINANKTDSIVEGIEGGAEPLCIRVNPKDGCLWVAGNCLGFSKITPPYETKEEKACHNVKLVDYMNMTTYCYLVYDKRKVIYDKPNYDGYEFLGYETETGVLYDFPITEDIILYAKWKKKS